MKVQRELCFYVPHERLESFINEIQSYATGSWSVKPNNGPDKRLIIFEYNGDPVGKALATLIWSNDDCSESIEIITNINLPLESNRLISKCNDVLMFFYRDIVEPYQKNHPDIVVAGPSSDIFDPITVMSKEALEKLKAFSMAANKTGSIHPSDREEWFGFICQTVDDDKLIDIKTLEDFLQDESYWKEQRNGVDDEVSTLVWDEEQAQQLASEYEMACEILQYYKRTRKT